jgi:hypothetical protein
METLPCYNFIFAEYSIIALLTSSATDFFCNVAAAFIFLYAVASTGWFMTIVSFSSGIAFSCKNFNPPLACDSSGGKVDKTLSENVV